METLTHISSNFTYDAVQNIQYNIFFFLNSINFDTIGTDHLIKVKSILDQGADLDIYIRYINSILNKNDKNLNPVLMETWSQLGANIFKLPIHIHEKCIKINPIIFERTILYALSVWEINNLIHMCSKSPLVFQMCSSILNELMIKLNFTDKFMIFLVHFLNSVSSQYKNNNIDIIDIYPVKCRNILILRAIKTKDSSLVSKYYLNEEVKQLAKDYPKESICLLSHFPDLYTSD